MKCVCGYEKLGQGYVDIPERIEYFKSGKRKGEVKTVHPAKVEFMDRDPDNDDFIVLQPDIFFKEVRSWSRWEREAITIYACPKCGTIKIEV